MQFSLTTRPAARRYRAATAAAALLLALLGTAVLARPASAGTYSVATCRGYGGSALTTNSTGWTSGGTQYGSDFGGCYGNGLRVDLSAAGVAVPAWVGVGWHFAAPANTSIHAFFGSWTGYARTWDGTSAGILHIVSDDFDLGQHYGGVFTTPTAIAAGGLNASWIDMSVGCQASSSCPANGGYGWLQIDDPRVVLTDNLAPSAGGTYGTAVSDSKWVGTERFNYAATDRGGGLRLLNTYIDGTLKSQAAVDSNGGLCSVGANDGYGAVYGSPVPCALSASSSTDIDSATAATDGSHTITYKIADVVGNETTLYSATKLVANHPPVNTALPVPDSPANFTAAVQGVALSFPDGGGTWTGPNLVKSYAWVRCDTLGANCAQIPGATALSYTPGADDLGHTLRLAVTATNPADSVTVYSAKSGVVTAPRSDGGLTDKPANGANGANGANASGSAGSIVTVPSLATSNTTNVLHTFVGRVAGEPNGVACPADKATLKFEHVKGGHLRLGHGKTTTAQVVLTCTNTGKAITGAKLELATKVGAHAAVASDVTTDGAGHAVLRIAKGASRGMTVGYRMYADDPMARAVATLKILVNSKVALRANRRRLHNGQAVILRGALAGGEVPRRGVTLAVQWKDGKRWRPFAQIKSTRKGTFAYAYKFTRTSRTIAYQLRVQVTKGQIDYPYLSAASKPVKVTVAP